MANVFDKFVTSEKKVKIKALSNQEITIRELTVAERKRIDSLLAKNKEYSEDGKILFDPVSYQDSQLLTLELAMVDPAMSTKELLALSASANEAISEIHEKIIDLKDTSKKK